MNFGCSPEASTRMDAGEEPPWMGLRRVSGVHPEFSLGSREIATQQDFNQQFMKLTGQQ